jgi:hypothetical protein
VTSEEQFDSLKSIKLQNSLTLLTPEHKGGRVNQEKKGKIGELTTVVGRSNYSSCRDDENQVFRYSFT